VNFSLLCKEQ